jgi:hypothetical protein
MSLVTGDVVQITETINDEATLEQRTAELKATAAAALGRHPAEAAVLAVTCDGCGDVTRIDYHAPELPPGWVTGEYGEFCPHCKWQAG